MGLEKIKEEILQKATAAEKEILIDAARKVDDIKIKTDEKVRQLEKEALQSLQAEIKAIDNRENSLANIEAQKMLFETKKEIIDNVYEEAFDKIKKMKKQDCEQIIKKLFEKAKNEIAVDVVYANERDKDFIDKDTTIKPLDMDGGIICETKDGTVRIDYTFKTLFEDLKEKTIKETSKILFG